MLMLMSDDADAAEPAVVVGTAREEEVVVWEKRRVLSSGIESKVRCATNSTNEKGRGGVRQFESVSTSGLRERCTEDFSMKKKKKKKEKKDERH